MNEIQFICMGVAKCGTSTLDSILRQFPNIELPLIKEPHFFQWKNKYKKPYDVLLKRYFTKNENVIKGIIDPTFVYSSVEDIRKYFGRDVKIILMIRNPVNALYSYFRMGLLMGYYSAAYKATKRNNYTTEKLFRNYFMKEKRYKSINLFHYSRVLTELGFNEIGKGGIGNVKIIIFERFINEPEKYIKEVLNFIGLRDEGKEQNYAIWENEGNRISRNYFLCKLSQLLNKLNRKTRDYPEVNMRVNQLIDSFRKLTTKEDNSKMDKNVRKRLEMYYAKEKKNIEKLIGESLENDWF